MTGVEKRETAILTTLRNGPQTSAEIAHRIGSGQGNTVSSRILSMRDRNLIQVSATRKMPDSQILLVYSLTKLGEKRSDEVRQKCPDGGTCHHNCLKGECFRVHHAGPLSDIYVGDEWPEDVEAEYADPPTLEAIFG